MGYIRRHSSMSDSDKLVEIMSNERRSNRLRLAGENNGKICGIRLDLAEDNNCLVINNELSDVYNPLAEFLSGNAGGKCVFKTDTSKEMCMFVDKPNAQSITFEFIAKDGSAGKKGDDIAVTGQGDERNIDVTVFASWRPGEEERIERHVDKDYAVIFEQAKHQDAFYNAIVQIEQLMCERESKANQFSGF